jgi:hypothetical protein
LKARSKAPLCGAFVVVGASFWGDGKVLLLEGETPAVCVSRVVEKIVNFFCGIDDNLPIFPLAKEYTFLISNLTF